MQGVILELCMGPRCLAMYHSNLEVGIGNIILTERYLVCCLGQFIFYQYLRAFTVFMSVRVSQKGRSIYPDEKCGIRDKWYKKSASRDHW